MRMPEAPARAGPNGGEKDSKLSFKNVAAHAIKIFGRLEVGQWAGKDPPMRKWLVDGLIPEGSVTTLYGDGGIGKSILAVQLLVACALDRQWIGRPTRACKAVGMFCEDSEEELHRRFHAACRHYGADPGDLAERLELLCRPGLDNSLMSYRDSWAAGEASEFLGQIHNLAVAHGAELVVLDSLHDVFTGNEVSRTQARQFIGELNALAQECSGAVVIVAHPSLTGLNTGSGTSGSTAWNNAVRSRLFLTAPKSDEDQDEAPNGIRELKTKKANYTLPGDRIKLHWHEGVFVADEEPQGIFGTIERRTAEQTFLDCLDALEKRGLRVNAIRNQPNFAPRQMLGMSATKGFTRADLELAMKRALEAGKIKVIEDGPPSRRRSYLARVPAQEHAE